MVVKHFVNGVFITYNAVTVNCVGCKPSILFYSTLEGLFRSTAVQLLSVLFWVFSFWVFWIEFSSCSAALCGVGLKFKYSTVEDLLELTNYGTIITTDLSLLVWTCKLIYRRDSYYFSSLAIAAKLAMCEANDIIELTDDEQLHFSETNVILIYVVITENN